MKKIRNKISSVIKDVKGVVSIEFALILPLLIMLLLGSVDLAHFLMAHQRISRAAYTISNLVTQMEEGLSESQVSDMMLALDQTSRPFSISNDGVATLTAVMGETNGNSRKLRNYRVAWKRCFGAKSSSSKYGAANSVIELDSGVIPDNMVVENLQLVVIAEVEYDFEPMIGFLPLTSKISYESMFRPRRGAINAIASDGSQAYSC
ncbi:TadE/TadG family type IV pilus assembly protein [Pseudemcibacter aquimaris]|uniref:TadE/TadG family type IV pilus assembly protein n=1 Tax=Pseudemcibacter aquimaris TaxID=2857064 RepID=UPI002011912E|nr:TadE/TadG family type IV pilus assembly protein [Pseudemcibacter aquimaris]MCC3859720.1 pilus assembly protein [Pseudemcibacter aquimaris]WDU60115.1 pilus assembly protein [Pseudemcibacter aquimaris]